MIWVTLILAVISSDIDGRWQLFNMEEDRTELNNLADDLEEKHNLSGKFPEKVKKLHGEWEALKGQLELNN